ncbi:hypothetical protein BS47DRAFT_1324593 [Hydnum rufescens UP504]|uniref:Heme haloperoxidase family profile domain-containing protein n=1 Tax=Hydnum rufescens UP504 TaxID=1448309 RepID=A0A9P6B876_9AGAM|nr:hypothetical protein BS47DRAFT_1324593 [Hydnum rufescens UP504]
MLTPRLKKGSVVKEGKPGHNGLWPEFIPPKATDSRSPCPGLNAMANHGILPRDGRNITKGMFNKALEDTWNFAPTLTRNTTNASANLFGRSTLDLADLAGHNIIEHDASLLRHDAFFQPDQSVPARDLIESLLASASGPVTPEHPKGQVTPGDLSRFFSLRLAQSKKNNPVFSISGSQRFFATSNASLIYDAVDGDVATLETLLLEERFPENFETAMRARKGYTIIDFALRSLEISLGVHTVNL